MRPPETMHRRRRELDLSEWTFRAPKEDDYSLLVTDPALVYDEETNDLTFAYLVLDDDTSDIEEALTHIRFSETARPNGVNTTQRIFGNMPRSLPRRDYCTAASLAAENPEAHQVIAAYADKITHYYKAYNPDLYERHQAKTQKVREDWRMEESVFTSGVINRDNALLYHYDSGNYTDVWSNMLVFRGAVAGGYLVMPEYDIAFALPNNSLMMFDGQRAMHGVTPIYRHGEDEHRYSIVFYSLKTMWSCLPIDDEVARARDRRTERERRRAREDTEATTT